MRTLLSASLWRKSTLVSLLLITAICSAQNVVTLSPVPKLQFFDASGRPLAFGCVFTYESQTHYAFAQLY